jgi:hypothetical protein
LKLAEKCGSCQNCCKPSRHKPCSNPIFADEDRKKEFYKRSNETAIRCK